MIAMTLADEAPAITAMRGFELAGTSLEFCVAGPATEVARVNVVEARVIQFVVGSVTKEVGEVEVEAWVLAVGAAWVPATGASTELGEVEVTDSSVSE